MTQPQLTTEPTPSTEDFAALLDETFRESDRIEGSVVTGTIIAIDNDEAVVDVGLKAEGRVPLKEFSTPGHPAEVQVGDRVEVYVERFENRAARPCSAATRRAARSWNKLEQAFKDNAKVQGMIFGRSRAALPSTSAAPSRSCPAARWTSDRCATSPPAQQGRAVPDPQDGPAPRHRGVRRAVLEDPPSSATSCWPRSRKARC